MSTDQPPPVRAGRHARPDSPEPADPAAQENGGELLVDQVDHRERFTLDWRNLPRPSLAALLGVAVLLLIAGGAVHLSS
ncbi:MAG: hypothetical protein Q4G40_02485, partial [Brachybacterium sp.]|nr:hypothetical protein [Brachybacterium sp.]